MPDLTKITAENQKERQKLIAPLNRKLPVHLNERDSESEPENISVARTSRPVSTNTAVSKTTPVNSRNNYNGENTSLPTWLFWLTCNT